MLPRMARLVLAILLPGVSCLASDADRFESQTAGFSFQKPSSWVFATVDAAQENRERIRLNDAELEAQLKSRATPALVMVTRHPEPYPDLNPSFQAGLRPLGDLEGKSARELIELILPGLQQAFADFRVVDPVRELVVGGLPAAGVVIEYTLKTADGGAFPTRSESYVVPRGKFMFFIGMGRNPTDAVAAQEQAAMLASIEIQP